MAVSYMDFTAKDVKYKANLEDHVLTRKNDENYIYELGIEQLNSVGNVSLLDIYLSDGNVVEAHYHQNASELIYCISGSAVVPMINPETDELITIDIQPAEVVSIPQGWWHYITATTDDTHLLSTFDTPLLQTIFGSQILRIMPKDALSHMYCLDEETVETALEPIDETVIIGPPDDCTKKSKGNNLKGSKSKNDKMSGSYSQKKTAKQAWRPYAPPFPGTIYPKR